MYAYRPDEHKTPTPGVHVFASKLAVARYIARYPYLLQEKAVFAQTLERHGWKVNTKGWYQSPLEKSNW